MKKFVLLMLFTSVAKAQINIPDMPEIKEVPVSRMNYSCASKGALFYLSNYSNRMFVSDPSTPEEGFELNNVEVKSSDCQDTHAFTGSQNLGGELVTYVIKTHGCGDQAEKIEGSVVTLDDKGKQVGKEISLACKNLQR